MSEGDGGEVHVEKENSRGMCGQQRKGHSVEKL